METLPVKDFLNEFIGAPAGASLNKPLNSNRDKPRPVRYASAVGFKTDQTPSVQADAKTRTRVSNTLFKPTERFYLSFESPIPLYHQIEKIILDRMKTEGAVGRMLPREMDMVKIFGVSRITVKKVADGLAAKGLILRRRSLGTQIVSLNVAEDLGRLSSYTEEMNKRGLQVSTEVLNVQYHVPAARVREKLRLSKGEKTLCIRRLRGTSEVFPVVLLQSEIPRSYNLDRGDDFGGSLYNLLEQKYRIPIDWAEEQISAGRATEEEAKYLRIPVHDVVLIMERKAFTNGNRPLEFVRAVYRPEHYTFLVRLKR
jgi:GntR family transcriptional regulator, N-acetylglucosamine utilization regulator